MPRVFAIVIVAALSGCTKNGEGDSGMYIYNNTDPTSATCVFTGDPTQTFLSGGEISSMSPVGYFLSPLLRSRITALMGEEQQRTIEVEGAHVTINGTTTDRRFAASLPPEGSANVGFELIPASMLSSPGVIVATVTPFGKMGGGDITGQPFDYPVTVCTNCIVVDRGLCGNRCSNNPAMACSLAQDCGGGACSMSGTPCTSTAQCGATGGTCAFPYTCGPSGITPRQGNPCNPYQDGIVDCCHSATGLVCPAM